MGAEKLDSTITGVEMFRKSLIEVVPIDNVGILLRGIEKTDISSVICKPELPSTHDKFILESHISRKRRGGDILHSIISISQFYIRTTDVTGEIVLPSGTEMVIVSGDNLNNYCRILSCCIE